MSTFGNTFVSSQHNGLSNVYRKINLNITNKLNVMQKKKIY